MKTPPEMTLFIDTVKVGKKGQFTLPKKLRDHDGIEEDDEFTLTRTPSGEITLRKKTVESPEDRLLTIINQMKRFDANKAWKEVLATRKREDHELLRRYVDTH